MITFNMRDFERAAARFGAAADQVPFAASQAMNFAVEVARKEIITTTWPQHMKVRNPRFIGAALTTKGQRATKRNLRVAIVDRLDRGSLGQHASGGVKKAKSNLAIPSAAVAATRSGLGVPRGLRPKALRAAGDTFRDGDAIYQRVGKGRTKRLKLMYTLKPSARIKPDVPFEADFRRVMTRQVELNFGPRLMRAMASRRARDAS